MTALTDCQPIIGCRVPDTVDATPYDRRWAVMDANGKLLDRASCPSLEKIYVTLGFGCLVIKAEGMLRLDIPLDVIEDDDSVVCEAFLGANAVKVIDEGDLSAAWVSNCLGLESRLVKIHPDCVLPVNWR